MHAVLIGSGPVLAILLAALSSASAQEAQKLYCLESQAGARNCVYESLDRCEQIVSAGTVSARCVINPALAGTTMPHGMSAARGNGPYSLDRLPAPVK